MKLISKKTIATLLTAIIIAMMVVMPALALNTDSTSLSVTVNPRVDLSLVISAVDLDFGEMYVDDSYSGSFTLTAEGTSGGTITSELESEDIGDFWMTYLTLTTTPDAYTIASTPLTHVAEETEIFVFTADLDVTGATPGTYVNAIVFWLN